jgi:MFS family permease
VANEEPPYPTAARAWWAVAVLLLLYVLSFVDRQVINLMVGPIRAQFGIGDFGASLLMGFGFAVFYTFFGIPIARLADSKSRRWIIAAGLAVWSATTAACGLARTYAQLLLARMGVGVGEAALSPSAYSLIADAFPPHRRGSAMGVYSMGSYLGSGLAFLLGGYLIAFVGESRTHVILLIGEVSSWQLVFLLVGIPGLVLVPLLATVVEPARRDVARSPASGASVTRSLFGMDTAAETPGEQGTSRLADSTIVARSGTSTRSLPFRATLRHFRENAGAYLCHNLGFALLAFSGYGSGAWTPAFLQRNHGMSAAESGIALGWIMTIAGTLGIVFGGWLADRLAARGRRDATMRVGLIAALVWIPAGVLYPLVSDRTAAALHFGGFLSSVDGRSLALALMIPALFTSGMPWGAAAAAVQEMTPSPMRAQATAVYLFVINLIGLGVGPSAVGYLTEYVFRDDAAVRYSLVWVTLAAHVGGAGLLWAGLQPFVRSRERCGART